MEEEGYQNDVVDSLMLKLFLMDLDEILQKIFLYLCPRSLHVSRQVCHEWNHFIKRRIWQSPFGRAQLLKKLQFQLKNATPRETLIPCHASLEPENEMIVSPESGNEEDLVDSHKPFYLAGDQQILVCGFYDGKAKVYDLNQPEVESAQVQAILECSKLDSEHNYNPVQLDVGKDVIVTVDVVGMVTVWRKKDFTKLYQVNHHGKTEVLGIKTVENLILTGGNDGSIALLIYEAGQVKMTRQMTDRDKDKINHLDCDGIWALTGHNRTAKLWNVEEGRLVETVKCGYVCCCALYYPFAVTTGMTSSLGVGLWDIEKGVCVRRLNPTLSMWVVQIQGNYLAASMAKGRDDTSPIIFIYDLGALTSMKIPVDKVWNRQLTCLANQPYDSPHVFLNKTNLFVTQEKFVKSFDFWNC